MKTTHSPSRLRTLLLTALLMLSVSAFVFRIDIMNAINTIVEGYRVVPAVATTIDATSVG
jgi:hypothetical protein